MQPLFVTGIARSGTSLTGRMLSANPDVMLAIDAFLPVFRWLRQAARARLDDAEQCDALDDDKPLLDYYFSPAGFRILDGIFDADLTQPCNPNHWTGFDAALACRAADEAADLIPFLKNLQCARTYRHLLEEVLDCIAERRNAGHRRYVGVKDVWIADFFPSLAAVFPEARFLIVVRDPRAVVASNEVNRGTDQYGHQISYARHWRKQVALALHFSTHPVLSGKVGVMRYEDLLRDPEGTARALCEFLDIAFDPMMLDTASYVDHGTGSSWTGNSNFGATSGFDLSRMDKWRSVLPEDLLHVVELICGKEMSGLGYVTVRGEAVPTVDVLNYFIENRDVRCSWRSDSGDPLYDYGHEVTRLQLLHIESPIGDRTLIRRCFLFENVFDTLRSADVPWPASTLALLAGT